VNAGIVTLEDIIENILKMEIEDEFDVGYVTRDKTSKDEILHLFDYRRTRGMEGMPPQEKTVVYRHLCREVKAFMKETRAVEDLDLQNLLASGKVWRVIVSGTPDITPGGDTHRPNMLVEDGGLLLYMQGVESEFFTFILDGKAEVFSGRQKFRSEVSRFTILCPEVLERTQQDYLKGLEFSSFVPDFTARVIQNSRILRISRANFHKCLQGKLKNYKLPRKDMQEKLREIIQRPNHHNSRFVSRVSYQPVRDSRRDYNINSSITSTGVQEFGERTHQYSRPQTLSSIIGESPNLLETEQRILDGGSLTSLSLSGAQTPSRPRQRFYDETYTGHESDNTAHNICKPIQAPKNKITDSTTLVERLHSNANLSQSIIFHMADDASDVMDTAITGEEMVTRPSERDTNISGISLLIS